MTGRPECARLSPLFGRRGPHRETVHNLAFQALPGELLASLVCLPRLCHRRSVFLGIGFLKAGLQLDRSTRFRRPMPPNLRAEAGMA